MKCCTFPVRRAAAGLGVAIGGLVLAVLAVPARCQDDLDNNTCMVCHEAAESAPFVDVGAFSGSPHGQLQCTVCHGDIVEVPHPESLASVDCSLCHTIESEIYLQSHHGRATMKGNDIAASCRDCHGPAHRIRRTLNAASPVNRTNVVATCATCHGDVEKMRQFNLTQEAPILSYGISVHGRAQDPATGGHAAICSDCHGSHDLHRATDRESKLFWQNIPATCGKCHENIRNTYSRSVHGKAAAAGNRDAPVCTTCHGEHNISAVDEKESSVYTSHIPETCGQCHAAERIITKYRLAEHAVDTYMESFHGLSLRVGSTTAANCASCHGSHDILPSSDPRSSVSKRNLVQTCGLCHPGVSDQVARGQIHSGTRPGLEHRATGIVRVIYLWLIAVVLGGMFVHNALDFWRKLKAHYHRNRLPAHAVRMHLSDRIQHVLLIVSFVVLATTGFALNFPNAWWVKPFTSLSNWRGYIHRGAAVIFIALSLMHLFYMIFTRRGRKHLFNLAPRLDDFVQFGQTFAYYLGFSQRRPTYSHFSYVEKAEYWALVWGSVIMTLTGAFMTWEEWAMREFPKWFFDVMAAIHYYEAILACSAIVIWHFYFVIFDPDEYPMKWTWLSGEETLADRHHRHTHSE